MRKFPTSIYSGPPVKKQVPRYRTKSRLDEVRRERSGEAFRDTMNQIVNDMMVYGTSYVRVAPKDISETW